MDAPICDCHGEPKVWKKSAKVKAGGGWTCVVRKREVDRKYYKSHPEIVHSRNRRRIMIGGRYFGPEHDDAKREYIIARGNEKLAEFKAKQAAETAESGLSLRHVYER